MRSASPSPTAPDAGVARAALVVGGLLGLLWAGAALLIGCWDVYQRETMSFPFNWVAPPTHGSPYHPALVTIWAAAGVAGLLGAVVVARRPRSAAILAAVAVVVGFVAAATVGDIWYAASLRRGQPSPGLSQSVCSAVARSRLSTAGARPTVLSQQGH